MAFDPLSSAAPLIIYIDFKSPYAYLAKDPTYALAAELGIEIDWRPFTLDIPSYLGSARLNKEGQVVESHRTPKQWTMVKYSYHDVRRYGSLRGLTVRGTTKIWDSSLAGIGMLWAKQHGDASLRGYIDRVYERFWKRELDIENIAVIERVLDEAGAPIAGFRDYASGEGRALHDDIQRKSFDAGIFGVPTYVVGEHRFFGREHLPRIRWILSGRHGAAPDVAYETGPTPAARSRTLGVAIDFTSPSGYLAVAPTMAIADQLGIEIDWQPFIAGPWKMPPFASPGEDRGLRHRRIRAEYCERTLMRYAEDRGVVIRGIYRETDPTLAALALLWVKREALGLVRTFVSTAFERYWREELNITNDAAMRSLLAEIGVPVAGFDKFVAKEGREELERAQTRLQDAKVFDVPTYLVNDDVFLDRHHLPLIRQLLSH